MQSQHPIDKLFGEALAGYEVMPRAAVWDRIDQGLGGEVERKAFALPRYWLMAAGLLLVVGLGSAWWLLKSNEEFSLVTGNVAYYGQVASSDNQPVNGGKSMASAVPALKRERTGAVERSSVVDGNANEIAVLVPSNDRSVPVAVSIAEKQTMNRLEPKVLAGLEINTPQAELAKGDVFVAESLPASTSIPYLTEVASKEHVNSTWMVGVRIAPTHSYRTLGASGTGGANLNEGGLSSLNGALVVKMARGQRWSFESGFGFSRMGQTISYSETSSLSTGGQPTSNYAAAAQSASTLQQNSMGQIVRKHKGKHEMSDAFISNEPHGAYSDGPTTTASVASGEIRQMLDYIELPLSARYVVSHGKRGAISVSGGLCANFLVGNKAQSVVDGSATTIGETENINSMGYSTHVGVGVDVPLLANVTMTIEPVFKYFLSSANHGSSTDFRPYSFGVNTGVSYRF